MNGQQTSEFDRILDGIACSVDALSALPAVPTLDWCDRAAAAVARLAQPAVAMITIGTLTNSGELVEHEVTGVGARQSPPELGRARPLNRSDIGFRGEDGPVGTLRVRAAQLRRLGLQLSAEQRSAVMIGALGDLPGGDAVASGELGVIWEDLQTTAPAVAVVPLGEPADGRVMIVQIAGLGSPLPAGIGRGLASVIPSLRRRTILALGAERAESTRWLTVREQQVLEELSLGKSVRQIADDLGRSPHTVHDHVKSLHRKLGASSRGELVARALGHTSPTESAVAAQAEPKPVVREIVRAPSLGTPGTGAIEAKPVNEPARFESDRRRPA